MDGSFLIHRDRDSGLGWRVQVNHHLLRPEKRRDYFFVDRFCANDHNLAAANYFFQICREEHPNMRNLVLDKFSIGADQTAE